MVFIDSSKSSSIGIVVYVVGLPRFPVPEPGISVVPGTREPGIWSGSKTVPGQAFLGKNCV